MNLTFDPHLFTHIGLDSGSLTMLGTIVHSFSDPGEYRAVVHEGEIVRAVFNISSDKASPNAQATIDLAALVSPVGQPHPSGCPCCKDRPSAASGSHRFVVNPRGYVLFHVSRGSPGYYVHVRRTDADQNDKGYDSRVLAKGDIFTATILRPGAYSITNKLARAHGEIVVSYPQKGEKRYRPPNPLRVVAGPQALEPGRLQTQPGQGIIFEVQGPWRIEIKLEKPDDGPNPGEPRRKGWVAPTLK